MSSSLYNDHPYSAVCKTLAPATPTTYSAGTAFLVGKRIALTAGHVIYAGNGNWVEDMHVTPHPTASDTSTGIYNRGSRVLKAIIPTNYKLNRISQNDWAILILEDDLGTDNSVWSLSLTMPNVNSEVRILSYPVINPRGMWLSVGKVYSKPDKLLRYTCDTAGGSSGAPVYTTTTINGVTSYKVVAIHSSGPSNIYNEGPQINRFITTEVARLNGIYS